MARKKDVTLAKAISSAITRHREKKYPGHGGKKKCAEEFGVNAQVWRDWETGHRTPGTAYQRELAAFFGISLAELRGESEAVPLDGSLTDDRATLLRQIEALKVENAALKTQVQDLHDEVKELTGALKHLKEMFGAPQKTATDAFSPSRVRLPGIKKPTETS